MSNYNVDTLENKIVVEAQEAIKSLEQIIGYVNQSKTAINSIKSATGLKSLDNQVKKTTSSLNKFQLVAKNLKSVLNFSGLIYGARRVTGFLTDTVEKSIDYIETLNLFEVSMGKSLDQFGNLDSASSKYYTKALKFQNDLNKAFGTNIEETMRYQALYNQMAESMGIGDNASYIISENLTKLGIDLASLFNKSEEDTMEALRAGVLAGQTKPLRNYGLDVTQQTLAPLASELGITESVKQLSQAEKMILRYIAVLRQASSAHGDFAKTIESPSNQLKVFKQQLAELKTAIGNLFQGMLGNILPVINGILMAIKEVIKAIATLFGFEVTSSNSNLADKTGIEDLEAGLSGAVGSARELRAQLFGFDEINNITTDTGSGGAGGGISSTGIDNKLLDAMKEYDNLMGNVKMKATEIRDKILEWLGFTGDVEHDTQRVKEILDTIEIVIKAVVGTWLGTKIVGAIGGIITGLGAGGVLGLTNKIQLAVAGIATSWALAKLSAQSYANAFKNDDTGALLGSMGMQAGSILAGTATGALIGSIVPGVGTAVGALFGTGIAAISSILATASESEKEVLNMLTQSMDESYETFKENAKRAKSSDYAYSIEDYNNYTGVYKDTWDLGPMWSELQKDVDKVIETYRNLALAEADLFDNGGQKVENYYNKYKQLVGEIVSSSDEWSNLHNKYLENEQVLEDAGASLDIFLSKMGNSAYKTTAEDISKLNLMLDEMRQIVDASGDAFVDSAVSLTNSLKEEGYISTETADLVVANAIRKAEAEGNAFDTYQLKLKDYSTQLKKGMITQDEYNRLISEAKTEYEKLTAVVDSTKTSVQYLEEQISAKIDFGSWETAKKYTEDLGNLYVDNEVKLKNYYESKVKEINDSIAWTEKEAQRIKEAHGEESQQYKDIQDQLKALQETRTGVSKQYEEDTLSLKKTVYESLKIVEKQLIDSGYNIQEDSKGIYKSVQEQLNKIGLDTKIASNIDKEIERANSALYQKMPDIRESVKEISGIIGELGGDFTLDPSININPKVNLQVQNLKNKLEALKNSISGLSGSLLNSSIKATIDTALSKLSNINAYAEGGFPDMGEIFLARERGPELVGRIGSRTAVANNSQIVEAVSNGVYTAVSEAMNTNNNGGPVRISGKLNGRELIQFTIDGINGIKQQTGECPIEVL